MKGSDLLEIDAQNLHYRALNERLRGLIKEGAKHVLLKNVCGQRYIGDAIGEEAEIIIEGVPGNDLAAFMDGPRIIIRGNAQDGVGNTMNRGEVVIHGDAGDIVGYSMRGGRIFIQGDVGYRVGIHMKAYKHLFPVVIVGGGAKDFLGEYMAGGLLVVLGLNSGQIVGDFVGAGMHGGTMFLRGEVDSRRLGKEVKIGEMIPQDMELLKNHLGDFCAYFGLDVEEILRTPFTKIYPYSHRPYGTVYAY
jgi:glutamate synthase domain-containing protein 3